MVGEAAAVHREDHAEDRHEEHEAAALARKWHRGIEQHAEREEHRVGRLAPDPVRERRPEDAAGDVEQAQQAGKARGGRRADPAVEDLLDHRRGHAEHADAGADVQAEDRPEQPELRRPPGRVRRHRARGHGGSARRRPSARCPARRGQPVGERAGHHRHEVDRAEHDEGLPHADRGRRGEITHQCIGQRRADHRAAAKPHDRQPGGHAASIREPLDQRGHRRDVAQAEAAPADHARA